MSEIQKVQNQIIDSVLSTIINANMDEIFLKAKQDLLKKLNEDLRGHLEDDPVIYTLIQQLVNKQQHPKQSGGGGE